MRAAGWHVTVVEAGTPLQVAWQRLPRAAEMLVSATTAYAGASTEPASMPDRWRQ